MTGSVDYFWSDHFFLDAYNVGPRSQKSYGTLDGRINFQPADGPWSIGLWGRNLTDETVRTFVSVGSFPIGSPMVGTLNEPFTFGVDFAVKF